VTDMVGNNLTETWNSRLSSEVVESILPQWAKDLRSAGYAKSIVVMAFLKWDREVGAAVAWGATKLGPVSSDEDREADNRMVYQ